jgi:hypothetical protein
MNARRTVLLALALTGSICAFAAGAAANTFTVAPLTLVTGLSPFAGCTVGARAGERPLSERGGGTVDRRQPDEPEQPHRRRKRLSRLLRLHRAE